MQPVSHRSARALTVAFGLFAFAASANAADLPSLKETTPAPVADSFQPFFVKLGFTYGLNTSSSHIWAQDPTALAHGVPAAFPAGVGATITNISTLGFEAGFFVTRNISVDVSGGIPLYVKDKTKGYNPANPVVTNGTVLGQIMPAIIPITVLYHFDNFGSIRPYIGAGVAVGFSFDNKNAFLNDIHVGSSAGPVVQGGVDYMIDRNWGVSLDVKKTFNYVESYANGINLPGIGPVPAKVFQHTHFEPWLFSVGLIYRFGGGEPIFAKY
ncbi:outer membrane beta-barrel protein [Rhodoblastus acidophilus]|uniref:Outer membrane beta-barrel protein n=1 Tax=Candidatus Rhodoblastus alkanivorans TaxID=2954117 RepID=A0ABS9Z1J7_9HYPH|nr:OmpW family outer membrane protein [Candidatus Rhodoblastus alkanivorans]MCI4679927.1 outer membrane beta-barrel protein [Candidatus Rhodoblastus alkanivorans]MCI4681498.1 outer membrane beta-barrel protein [Candidatus Rhodoblastus alkanivorans]MDI4642546.1 outer membrane beta-barrel protein [Rhodoblastus acidophilus]